MERDRWMQKSVNLCLYPNDILMLVHLNCIMTVRNLLEHRIEIILDKYSVQKKFAVTLRRRYAYSERPLYQKFDSWNNYASGLLNVSKWMYFSKWKFWKIWNNFFKSLYFFISASQYGCFSDKTEWYL